MDTSKRRTFSKLWQKTCSQSKLTEREGITSLWNSKPQEPGWKIHNILLPNQDCSPHLLTIQKTCCCQGTDCCVTASLKRRKTCGSIEKTLLGNGWGCSSFLSFWLGFYSVKYKEKYVPCFPYQNLQCLLSCWMLLWPAVPKISWQYLPSHGIRGTMHLKGLQIPH